MSWQSEMDWQKANGYKEECEDVKELVEYIKDTRSDGFCSSNLMNELLIIQYVSDDAKPGYKHIVRRLNRIGYATLVGFRLLEKNKL